MVELLSQYGLFLAQVVTVVIAIIVIIGVATAGRVRESDKGRIEVRHLNSDFDDLEDEVGAAIMDRHQLKEHGKQKKKADKQKEKEEKKAAKVSGKALAKEKKSIEVSQSDTEDNTKQKLYVLDFVGDIKASGHELLAKEISAVLMVAQKKDEVLVRLESPGGMVHSYGLCSSQLDRIKKQGIQLTICVDQVAASGGYMMACIGDKILAAPFAIIGSIGVMATVTNFHRILKKNDVDVDVMTAGKFKRTVSTFGEITDEGRKKFVEELEDTHELFKEHITSHREGLNIEDVATGEYWYGLRALKRNLVDDIMTSDEYLLSRRSEADIYSVQYKQKKSLADKIGFSMESALTRVLEKLVTDANFNRFQ